MMDKKQYSDPELQVRRFEQIDLIGTTTSGTGEGIDDGVAPIV